MLPHGWRLCIRPLLGPAPTRLHHLIPLIPAISATMHGVWRNALLLACFVLSHAGMTGDDFLDEEGDSSAFHRPERCLGVRRRHSWDLCWAQDALPARTEGWRRSCLELFDSFTAVFPSLTNWIGTSRLITLFVFAPRRPEEHKYLTQSFHSLHRPRFPQTQLQSLQFVGGVAPFFPPHIEEKKKKEQHRCISLHQCLTLLYCSSSRSV